VSKDVQLAIRREKFDVNLVRLSENNFCKPCEISLPGGWISGINRSTIKEIPIFIVLNNPKPHF
jgi:hypothetical protein